MIERRLQSSTRSKQKRKEVFEAEEATNFKAFEDDEALAFRFG